MFKRYTKANKRVKIPIAKKNYVLEIKLASKQINI